MSDKTQKLKQALEILAGIQEQLRVKLSEEPPAPEDIQTAKDGKTFRLDGPMEPGTAIYEQTTEGEVPAKDGDIELDNGKLITVKDGKIAEIKDSPLPPAEGMEEFRAQFSAQAETVKLQAKKIQSLEAQIQKILEARKAENKLLLDNQAAMFEAIQGLAEAPNGGEEPGARRTFPKTTKSGPLYRNLGKK